MGVLGGADDDGIVVREAGVEFAEIGEAAGIGEFRLRGVEVPFVDIAKGGDFHVRVSGDFADIARTTPADADEGDAEFAIGRGRAGDGREGQRACGEGGRLQQETTARG